MILFSAILPTTPCWPGTTHLTVLRLLPCQSGRDSSPTSLAMPSLTLRPGGYFALLLGAQTEKDLPAGFGYLDHAFLGYSAALRSGFQPERRISCPMAGAYTPQQVRRARQDGRLLGQVRDLLLLRKPIQIREIDPLRYSVHARAHGLRIGKQE